MMGEAFSLGAFSDLGLEGFSAINLERSNDISKINAHSKKEGKEADE